ncbi:MAG: MFS transporter, partial [Deinococcota bacterium]
MISPPIAPSQQTLNRARQQITWSLFGAQSLGSAGFSASATVASIVGATLSGRESLAGLPTATLLAGSAVAALCWGLLMDKLGRRRALTLGLFLGLIGAAIVFNGIVNSNFAVVLSGLVLMGSAQATTNLGRFVAAEVTPLAKRGRAVANVVLGGTVGAVIGPLLVGRVTTWASAAGYGELSGPYIIAMVAFALSAFTVLIALRPEPKDIVQFVDADLPDIGSAGRVRSIKQLLRDPGIVTAMISMVLAQAVMVGLMVITSLHMVDHNHTFESIGQVISSHTFGMFAPSIITGQLIDRFGASKVIIAGAFLLVLSGIFAPMSMHVIPLALALFVLGLGWNFCFVGGSALLSSQLLPAERSRTQGI